MWSTRQEQAEEVVSNENGSVNQSAMVSEDGKNIRTLMNAFRLFFTIELSSMISSSQTLEWQKNFSGRIILQKAFSFTEGT